MRNGNSTAFVNVPALADNGIIKKAYLHDMEAAIKQRTPIAGENITIKVTDGGYLISSTSVTSISNNAVFQDAPISTIPVLPPTTTSSTITNPVVTAFREIILNVCSNGVPGTIIVFGPVN